MPSTFQVLTGAQADALGYPDALMNLSVPDPLTGSGSDANVWNWSNSLTTNFTDPVASAGSGATAAAALAASTFVTTLLSNIFTADNTAYLVGGEAAKTYSGTSQVAVTGIGAATLYAPNVWVATVLVSSTGSYTWTLAGFPQAPGALSSGSLLAYGSRVIVIGSPTYGDTDVAAIGSASPLQVYIQETPVAYDVTLVQFNGNIGGISTFGLTGFSSSFDFLLMSMWVCLPEVSSSFTSNLGPVSTFCQIIAVSERVTVELRDDSVAIYSATYSGPVAGQRYNLLVSVDAATQMVQIYINDHPANRLSGGWLSSSSMGTGGSGFYAVDLGSSFGLVFPAMADLWMEAPASFVDLSIVSNRRKFINADLSPVDLGPAGAGPFGSSPPVFLTVPAAGVPTDLQTNFGTGGALSLISPTVTLSFQAGGTCTLPTPPADAVADLAELFFSPTTAFVDFTLTANREKFRSATGATVDLGVQGATPFGTPPSVMLRATVGDADAFADNDGFGGAFAITGGSLALADSRPTCSETTALAPEVQGADPLIILSVSDDGGRTFSLQRKARSLGRLGEYLKRIRWLKLGQFRQRIIRLEITDPVRRNFVGFYTDVTKGMD